MRHSRTVLLLLAMLGLFAPSAQAQVRTPRTSGLFGSPSTSGERWQTFDLLFSLNGGYDDNLSNEEGSPSSQPLLKKGSGFAGAGVDLTYGLRRPLFSVAVDGSGLARQYFELRDAPFLRGSLGAAFTVQLGRRTQIGLRQQLQHTPYFQLWLFDPLAVAPANDLIASKALDYLVSRNRAFSTATAVTLQHTLSRKTVVDVSGGSSSHRYLEGEDFRVTSTGASTHVRYALRRGATLRAGYFYQPFDYVRGQQRRRFAHQGLEIGLDYSPRLSVLRKSLLTFSTGAASLQSEGQGEYRFVGKLGLFREIGRTWRASVTYERGVQLVEGVDELPFGDTVGVSIDGFVGRRVNMQLWTAYAHAAGLSGKEPRTDIVTGSSLLRIALSRHIGFDARYVYYWYDFGTAPQLPFVPGSLNRHAVTAGLVFWVPLHRRTIRQ